MGSFCEQWMRWRKGYIVPDWPEGSIAVTLLMDPITQHKVCGGGEVEHGGYVDTGLLAGVEGLRLPGACTFHCRAIVCHGHNELVLPARQGGEKSGGDGDGESGTEAAAGKHCWWRNPSQGCGEQSCWGLHLPCCLRGPGDGAEGKYSRLSLGMGRCHGCHGNLRPGHWYSNATNQALW